MEGNGGCTTVCNGASGDLEMAMGRMPGQAMRLLVHRLAFASADIRLNACSFIVFVC